MPSQEFLMTPGSHLLCTHIVQILQQQRGEKSFIAKFIKITIQHAALMSYVKQCTKMVQKNVCLFSLYCSNSKAMSSGRDENLLRMTKDDLQRWIQEEVDRNPHLMQRREQLTQVEEWVKLKERDSTYTRLLYSNASE